MTSRIACAGISGRIIQGRVSADGKSFVGQTKDVTSDVLAAVIDKLKHHGGSFTINCNGEPAATVTLSDPGAERTDGWIPVSERLPDIAQEVIVDSEFDGVTAGLLDSYGEWYSPNSDYKLTRVVAWQPLPMKVLREYVRSDSAAGGQDE